MKNLLPQFWCQLIATALLSLGTAVLQAQTFPASGFTLPVGKTIVITYEVDVNGNVCPNGTLRTDLSNQSNVSGSNFATVQTDEPSNPAANPSPTLTPVSDLTLGNLVYKDVNKNGVFDAGDTGIDGVNLKLYTDANSNGFLDAGDGASIATATTAGGSNPFQLFVWRRLI
jgi:SdrD B-like domain